jgi:hypothetical protein
LTYWVSLLCRWIPSTSLLQSRASRRCWCPALILRGSISCKLWRECCHWSSTASIFATGCADMRTCVECRVLVRLGGRRRWEGARKGRECEKNMLSSYLRPEIHHAFLCLFRSVHLSLYLSVCLSVCLRAGGLCCAASHGGTVPIDVSALEFCERMHV